MRALLKFPKVKWVLFQDDIINGQYYRCECGCKNILLDALNMNSIRQYLHTFPHEVAHSIFDLFPTKLTNWLDYLMDITHGHQSLLMHGVNECSNDIVIYEW